MEKNTKPKIGVNDEEIKEQLDAAAKTIVDGFENNKKWTVEEISNILPFFTEIKEDRHEGKPCEYLVAYGDITPIIAEFLRKIKWDRNRSLAPLHVSTLRKKIQEKSFDQSRLLNAFYVDEYMQLSNGNHRTKIMCDDKVTLFGEIVFGAPREKVKAMDTARYRQLSQTMGMFYDEFPKNGATVYTNIDLFINEGSNGKKTITELEQYHKVFGEALAHVNNVPKLLKQFNDTRKAALVLSCWANKEKFDTFIEGVNTGANLPGDSPMLSIRNTLSNSSWKGKSDPIHQIGRILMMFYKHSIDVDSNTPKYMKTMLKDIISSGNENNINKLEKPLLRKMRREF